MTSKELLNLSYDDYNSLNKKDLARAVGQLRDVANKRLVALKDQGLWSPAASYTAQHGGKFSTRGKTLPELKAEFARVRAFLTSPTSTVTGAKRAEKQISATLYNTYGITIPRGEFKKMWAAFEKLRKSDAGVGYGTLKYKVLTEVARMTTDKRRTAASIARKLKKDLTAIYEKNEETYRNAGFQNAVRMDAKPENADE